MTTDEKIRETLHERLPRFLAAGVDYNDVQQILRIPYKYRPLMADWAARHLA